jgi:hypothetical protein
MHHSQTPGSQNTETRLAGRFWPTDKQRPGETVREWCRRLDAQPHEPWVADPESTAERAS